MKAFWRNAALLAVSLLPFSSANALALQAKQYGDFDRYVLALSWQTGFCQSQHDRNRNERDECRLQTETTNKADFLTVHGLWPGLPKSVAARGVDERRWMRFGCATRPIPNLPEARASRMCSSPETGLSLEKRRQLQMRFYAMLPAPRQGGEVKMQACQNRLRHMMRVRLSTANR